MSYICRCLDVFVSLAQLRMLIFTYREREEIICAKPFHSSETNIGKNIRTLDIFLFLRILPLLSFSLSLRIVVVNSRNLNRCHLINIPRHLSSKHLVNTIDRTLLLVVDWSQPLSCYFHAFMENWFFHQITLFLSTSIRVLVANMLYVMLIESNFSFIMTLYI